MIIGHKNLNPFLAAEPFQASQGDVEPTSPKDLQDYYEDMEKRDLERRQSRGKSRRWTRKGSGAKGESISGRRIPEQEEPDSEQVNHSKYEMELQEQQALDADPSTIVDMRADSLVPPRWSYQPPEHIASLIAPPTSYRTSYKIHNPVGPRFYRNHHLRPLNNTAVSAALFPSSAFSNAFPPLAALPPASPPTRGLGLGHTHLHPHNQVPIFPSPGTSRSSVESILPTPDSSQSTFLGPGSEVPPNASKDANGSAVADPVDLLDGSNPWGQKFHHDSPYDLGKKGKGNEQGSRTWAAASSSAVDLKPPRSRASTQAPRKATPSPLSQSTSALNVHSEGEDVFTPKRKLSKRRGNGLKSLFGQSQSNAGTPVDSRDSSPPVAGPPADSSVSLFSPAIPQESDLASQQSHLSVPVTSQGLTRKLSKTRPTNASTGSLVTTPAYSSSPDRSKRTSVLGRIAKRFSIARKPDGPVTSGRRVLFDKGKGKGSAVSLTETDVGPLDGTKKSDTEVSVNIERPQEPRKNTDLRKRIPPPSLEPESSQSAPATSSSTNNGPPSSQPAVTSSVSPPPRSSTVPRLPDLSTGGDLGILKPPDREEPHVRDSLMSVDPEAAWRLGKLTIANPDLFGGSETDLSVRGDGDTHPLPRSDTNPRMSMRADGEAQSVTRGNAYTPLQSGREPAPPVPPKERESILSEQSALDQTPRASVANPPPPPKAQAPSPEPPLQPSSSHEPELPPPPLPKQEQPPPESEKSLPPIESAQLRWEPSSKPEAPLPKLEPSATIAETSESEPELAISSYTRPSRHVRQHEEHEYIIDVPVDGSLFARTAPGGGSAPPLEKPVLPALPPKSRPREGSDKAVVAGPSLRTSSKETIFTSIFATSSRSRNTSESSPNEGSSLGHGQGHVSASAPPPRGHVRKGSYSPEKPAPIVYVRAGSESPDKEGRRERARERDDRDRRRDRRVSERESEREKEDKASRRDRERRESSVRRHEKEISDRERDRRRGERDKEREERERLLEKELVRERERDKERGRQREREKEKEREEKEREKIRQREREREREEKERERGRAEKEREKMRQREREREREQIKERERERERAKEREREEKAKAKEREKEREREKARELEREREKTELERVREREKAKELEREREREKAKELERERERLKEREREEREKEERAHAKERDRLRRKEQDLQIERETERYRLVPRHRASSSNNNQPGWSASKMDVTTDDDDDLVRLSAHGRDWEIVESSRSRKKGREYEDRRGRRENGHDTNTAAFPRRSSTNIQRDVSQLTDRARREARAGDRPYEVRTGVSLETSSRGPRQRAFSLEAPHSRPTSARPPSPPAKDPEPRSRRNGPEDIRYSKPSSSAPFSRPGNTTLRPDLRSTTTPYAGPRPSSGFPSPDSQFKAREAWQRDRMWRGQSMTFVSDTTVGSSSGSTVAPLPNGVWGGIALHDPPTNYGSGHPAHFYHQPPPAHHGSSYTSFMVQPAWPYPQYPQPPPPPPPIAPFSLQSSTNPLPPPPRESTFDTRTSPRS